MQYLKFKIKDMFTVAVKGQIPPNQIQCSLVKPPPSVQAVVWWYNEFGDKLRDIENRNS